ncbi:hypothetical protein RFI_14627 [Reticulomyxa filosa]|uniref:Uncharacterized protein n=1 Tax=Reticulomyxa filosa TaxID=46433 RepID=X6NB71_RETFI|nr:hypothetical protein RFI_14627 [Reticulomyxa filosa]|eukprot:ETO22567.1 hypothetical protein RFI_14627 [Reticulomyxa filosa]
MSEILTVCCWPENLQGFPIIKYAHICLWYVYIIFDNNKNQRNGEGARGGEEKKKGRNNLIFFFGKRVSFFKKFRFCACKKCLNFHSKKYTKKKKKIVILLFGYLRNETNYKMNRITVQILLFVYDQANMTRKYDCPLVFLEDGTKDPKYVKNPWGYNLRPTNVRYDPAAYAVSPFGVTNDVTCIAMTRSLGDFYAHQFGLSHHPDLTFYDFDCNDECI